MHRINTPTKAIDKFGAGKHGFNDGDKTIPIAATQFNAAWADSVQEELCNAIVGTGGVLDLNDNFQLLKQMLALGRHGECRLVLSGGSLKLCAYNGNRLLIDGASYVIPSAGVTLAPTGLTPGTLYYIYAYISSGAIALEAIATGHSTDADTGVEIKTGDSSRSLVGMAYCLTGPAWVDTDEQMLVLSWFNRKTKMCRIVLGATSTTTSNAPTELNNLYRGEFLSWGDDNIVVSSIGLATNLTSIDRNVVGAIGIDGVSVARQTSVSLSPTNLHTNVSVTATPLTITEDRHLLQIFGATNTGTTAEFMLTENSAKAMIKG